MSLFEPIFEALNRAQVRYVVVGGFATVLHGHARLTADIDLVIDLSPRGSEESAGHPDRPGLQTPCSHRAARLRRPRHPANPMREVDLFVEHLIAFDELWNRSEIINLSHTTVRIASIPDLIEMADPGLRQQADPRGRQRLRDRRDIGASHEPKNATMRARRGRRPHCRETMMVS